MRVPPGSNCTSIKRIALTLALMLLAQNVAWAKDGPIRCLSDGEKGAILGGAAVLGVVARLIPDKTADSTSYAGYRSNSLDHWWRMRLHGGAGRKSNLIDNSAGSLIAPVTGAVGMALIDIDRREFSRDIPVFVAGALTTGAITDIGKRVINRPRPYCQEGGIRPAEHSASDSYNTESFFSGHSSQAFFAAGFVNNRLRRHMRQEWRRDEYRSWRWTSPLLCYGWATFVAGSRIQADKHHFTDVLTGALVGYGLSELFYRMAYEPGQTPAQQSTPTFSLVLRF